MLKLLRDELKFEKNPPYFLVPYPHHGRSLFKEWLKLI